VNLDLRCKSILALPKSRPYSALYDALHSTTVQLAVVGNRAAGTRVAHAHMRQQLWHTMMHSSGVAICIPVQPFQACTACSAHQARSGLANASSSSCRLPATC
jgi:hypothetical protein